MHLHFNITQHDEIYYNVLKMIALTVYVNVTYTYYIIKK